MDPNTCRNLVYNKNGILFREENDGFLYTLWGNWVDSWKKIKL